MQNLSKNETPPTFRSQSNSFENPDQNSIENWLENQFKRPKRLMISLLILIGVVFFIIPVLLIQDFGRIHFDENTSLVGNTFGGIVGPLIAFIGVFITFFAFYMQYRANQIQYDILRKQAILQRKQDVERRSFYYFDVIRNLKENEISRIGNEQHESSGRSFNYLINEYIAIYSILESLDRLFIYLKHKKKISPLFPEPFDYSKAELSDSFKLSELSWHFCFEGLANPFDSEKFVIEVFETLGYDFLKFNRLSNVDIFLSVLSSENFVSLNLAIRKYYNDTSIDIAPMIKVCVADISTIREKKEKGSFSFNGHSEILSNYFQLNYQVVKYINEDKALNYEEKYELVKLLRAQMSREEMTVLFLNSLHEYGKPWEFDYRGYYENIDPQVNADSCLITKYNLIKNIQIVEGITIAPEDIFPDLIFAGISDEIKSTKKNNRIYT